MSKNKSYIVVLVLLFLFCPLAEAKKKKRKKRDVLAVLLIANIVGLSVGYVGWSIREAKLEKDKREKMEKVKDWLSKLSAHKQEVEKKERDEWEVAEEKGEEVEIIEEEGKEVEKTGEGCGDDGGYGNVPDDEEQKQEGGYGYSELSCKTKMERATSVLEVRIGGLVSVYAKGLKKDSDAECMSKNERVNDLLKKDVDMKREKAEKVIDMMSWFPELTKDYAKEFLRKSGYDDIDCYLYLSNEVEKLTKHSKGLEGCRPFMYELLYRYTTAEACIKKLPSICSLFEYSKDFVKHKDFMYNLLNKHSHDAKRCTDYLEENVKEVCALCKGLNDESVRSVLIRTSGSIEDCVNYFIDIKAEKLYKEYGSLALSTIRKCLREAKGDMEVCRERLTKETTV